jgi:hypothetical protein
LNLAAGYDIELWQCSRLLSPELFWLALAVGLKAERQNLSLRDLGLSEKLRALDGRAFQSNWREMAVFRKPFEPTSSWAGRILELTFGDCYERHFKRFHSCNS